MSFQLITTQTQVSYNLVLTRTVESGDDTNLSILPLVQLTTLFFWLWSFYRFCWPILEWIEAVTQLAQAIGMVTKVYQVQFEILLTSFRYAFNW